MNWGAADDIDRTAKILIDSGKVGDYQEARQYLAGLVLQVAVGPEIEHDPAAQAALATVVNVGRRAYRGGVHVRLDLDPILSTGWTADATASQIVTRYAGTVVERLADERPTLVIGRPEAAAGKPVLHLTWDGWSGGVVQSSGDVLCGSGVVSAGILAAALGISETFQQQLGAVVPGRRDVGISLWAPDLDWRAEEAIGPPLLYLPAALWLLGLGHLGQAYAWTLGMLPYAKPSDAHLGLVDFDVVVKGNTATQLLTSDNDVGRRKTRTVAAALDDLGFTTRIVERAFDRDFHPVPHGTPARNEPTIALAGFDDIEPRRSLGKAGFARVIDAGLGAGPVEYLDMVLHTFPAAKDPADAFPNDPRIPRPLGDAYEAEVARQVKAGTEATAARCGMLDIAGITVGAAFVGTFASTLVVADILRLLHSGANYSVIAVDLRNPGGIRAISNSAPGDFVAPGYTRAR
ncbi:MAG TPA: ThiF family adenylyltransferase [Acidimicrobiales bacterium]|nr:ThiF family adenylyltransferase [Acidimicrobiales bacterium]